MRGRSVFIAAAVAVVLAACGGGGDSGGADAGATTSTSSTLYPGFVDVTTTLPVATGQPVAPGQPVLDANGQPVVTAPPPPTVPSGNAGPVSVPQAGASVDTPGGTVTASGVSYVVQSGDSLRAIARKFGTSVDALIALNGLQDPDSIRVGQRIQLPASALGGVAAGPGVEVQSIYVVETGDTMAKIARKFSISTAALIAANPGANPDVIQVGQKLAIPAGATAPPTTQAPAAAAPAPAPAPAETVAPETVAPGA
jgi:LysM repeat protein